MRDGHFLQEGELFLNDGEKLVKEEEVGLGDDDVELAEVVALEHVGEKHRRRSFFFVCFRFSVFGEMVQEPLLDDRPMALGWGSLLVLMHQVLVSDLCAQRVLIQLRQLLD